MPSPRDDDAPGAGEDDATTAAPGAGGLGVGPGHRRVDLFVGLGVFVSTVVSAVLLSGVTVVRALGNPPNPDLLQLGIAVGLIGMWLSVLVTAVVLVRLRAAVRPRLALSAAAGAAGVVAAFVAGVVVSRAGG